MADIWSNNPLQLDGSRVIDRRIYLDPAIHAQEQERIFARTWQWIAHESELPEAGDYVTATVAGRAVVVARDRHGAINAFFNTCTHRGAVLAVGPRGNCRGGFVCMYHGWCFDAAGRFVGAPLPAAYGQNLRKECYHIPSIRLETFAGNVFVCLDARAPALEEFLGEAAPYIREFTANAEALGRVRWVIEGNWKLWHENFRDNYHPAFTHPLVGTSYQGVKVEGTNHELAPGHGLLAFPMQRDINQLSAAFARITGREIDLRASPIWQAPPIPVPPGAQNRILAVFPNLDLQNMGNGVFHNILQTVRPVGLDRAIVEAVAFGEKGESAEARRWRLARALDTQTAAGKVSGDDNESVRRCSLGFSTLREVRWSNMDRGQAPGRQGAKQDEYSLRAFYVLYKQYMGDALGAPA